jgi:hypothetical protein
MVVQVDLQDAPHPGAFRQDMSSEVRPHVRANLLFKDELWYATRCLQTLLPGASHSLLSSNRDLVTELDNVLDQHTKALTMG